MKNTAVVHIYELVLKVYESVKLLSEIKADIKKQKIINLKVIGIFEFKPWNNVLGTMKIKTEINAKAATVSSPISNPATSKPTKGLAKMIENKI